MRYPLAMAQNFDAMLEAASLRPVDVASRALCSEDTINRARAGRMPLPAILAGIAKAVGQPIDIVRAAIAASKVAKARAGRS